MINRMPTLFVSHGGPNIVIELSEAHEFLKSLATYVPEPKAIVIVSAHFETNGVAVVTDPAPETVYDFGGFAPELYQKRYPAPGNPALAERVSGLLEASGFEPQRVAKRGFDHGVWNPLILAWPEADVPVVQVSIDPTADAEWHYRIGAALSDLRNEDVLLIGSGHITHNLRAVFSAMQGVPVRDAEMTAKVDAFTDWFAQVISDGDIKRLLSWRDEAPFIAENHPTDEHLMPIFFVAGAAGDGAVGRRIHASRQYGFFAWDSYLFE
ncbi:MAG: class III extradiol ring-cleavage dioxygenase [Ahrensia sp.]